MPGKAVAVVPSAATLSSLMLGALAIIVVHDQQYALAAALILSGALLDMADGQLALRLHAVSHLGKELDSLADMVTFGVAPGMLTYRLLLDAGVALPLAILVSLVFLAAGGFRLARFNTLPSDRAGYCKGMTIPTASLFVLSGSFWQEWTIGPWWPAAVVAVSCLMVSALPYPKPRHLMRLPRLSWAGLLILACASWLAMGWQGLPFGLCALYALSGPAFWLYGALRRRLTSG